MTDDHSSGAPVLRQHNAERTASCPDFCSLTHCDCSLETSNVSADSSATRVLMLQALWPKLYNREEWTQPSMLHKCANPSCAVPFRSLREGKLFLAETFPANLNASFDGNRRKVRRREHFWLCDACAAQFTLRFDANLGMSTVPLSNRAAPRFLTRTAAAA